MPLTPDYRDPAQDMVYAKAGWLQLAGPPLVSYGCWPVFLLSLGYFGVLLAFLTMILCIRWGWSLSKRVAASHDKRFPVIAIIEILLILSSYPAFGLALRFLDLL